MATASGSGDRPNGVGATAPDKEQNLKRLYQELLDYQNRHDLAAVRKLVWSSPSTLFVAKAPVGWHGYWGIDDVMQHLQDMYRTPFRIDPNYDEEKVALHHSGNCGDYAPVRITVAYGGQNPVPALDQDSAGLEDDDGYSDSSSLIRATLTFSFIASRWPGD